MSPKLRVPVLLLAFVLPFARVVADEATDLASAYELFAARKDAEAKAAYEAILANNPKSDQALYYLARLAKRRHDWATVAERMEEAVKLAPDNASYWGDLGEAYGAQTRHASPLTQLGLARKTLAALKKAAELDPNDIEIRDGLIEYYRDAPWIAGGGMEKAYKEAKAMAKLNPFRSAMALGNLNQHEKKWADAEANFREAKRLQPDNPDAQYALAQLFSLTGRTEEAFAMFEDMLQTNPNNYAALYQIGRIAAASGKRLDRGEAALRRYLATPVHAAGLPSHANAWYRLGNVLERKGDTEGARDAYRKAVELDPRLEDAENALKHLG